MARKRKKRIRKKTLGLTKMIITYFSGECSAAGCGEVFATAFSNLQELVTQEWGNGIALAVEYSSKGPAPM